MSSKISKRGEVTLQATVAGIVSVVVLVIAFFFLANVVEPYVKKSPIDKTSKSSFDRIVEAAFELQSLKTDHSIDLELINIKKPWVITSFQNEFPCRDSTCICICEKGKCTDQLEEKRDCEDISFENVEFPHELTDTGTISLNLEKKQSTLTISPKI